MIEDQQVIENNELPERDDIPADLHEQEKQFLADRRVGFQAGTDGEEFDEERSAGWQRGWADAQE